MKKLGFILLFAEDTWPSTDNKQEPRDECRIPSKALVHAGT